MSTRKIRIVVVLMALAVISLIAVQAVWINNIIAVSKEELRRNSLEAMGAITDKLQKEEKRNFLSKKILLKENNFTNSDTTEVEMIISSREVSYNSKLKMQKDSSIVLLKKGNLNKQEIQLKINTDV